MIAAFAPRRALTTTASPIRAMAGVAVPRRTLSAGFALYAPPDDLVTIIAVDTVIAAATIIAGSP